MYAPRQLCGRLSDDVLRRAARTPLAEIGSSGLLSAICERVIGHAFVATGVSSMLAYAALVVYRPESPTEVALVRYPTRTALACAVQATICLHPIGCRGITAELDAGDGHWRAFAAGDVALTVYDPAHTGVVGSRDQSPVHTVRRPRSDDLAPWVVLRLLLTPC